MSVLKSTPARIVSCVVSSNRWDIKVVKLDRVYFAGLNQERTLRRGEVALPRTEQEVNFAAHGFFRVIYNKVIITCLYGKD